MTATQKATYRRIALWLLVIIPLVPAVVISAVVAGYMYLPLSQDKLEAVTLKADAQHTVIAVHGLGDTAQSWATPLMENMAESLVDNSYAQHIALNWNPYSQNTLRCSVDGKRIGYKLGEKLAAQTSLHAVHLIGHSCGSFVILGACEALKANNANIHIQTTYLDPVSIYGGFFWRYGLGKFGSCADDSEAYIDTGDGVPGSNETLPHATTHDVTANRLASDYKGNPHVWPTVYYQNIQRANTAPSAHPRQHN